MTYDTTGLDPQRTIDDLKELRTLTGNEHGAQRVAFTPTWLKAREWLQNKLAELPVEIHRGPTILTLTDLIASGGATGVVTPDTPDPWLRNCIGALRELTTVDIVPAPVGRRGTDGEDVRLCAAAVVDFAKINSGSQDNASVPSHVCIRDIHSCLQLDSAVHGVDCATELY